VIGWIFAIGGMAAGFAEACLLARAARIGSGPFSLFVRLLLVGAVFFLAARTGRLAISAVGWIVGFGATVVLVRRRLS